MKTLELKNIHASIGDKKILRGIDLSVNEGEICVLLGPNGAGKSTISNVIMGNPKYGVTDGMITLNGESILELGPDERAKKGIFMSFQHPVEIEGITLSNFLRTSYNMIKGTDLKVGDFQKLIKEKMDELGMDPKFRTRSLNVGFSGGEKKRSEILQLVLFEPDFAILDEIDSGLDVDALKIVSENIMNVAKKKKVGILIITHYNKILQYLKPDKVFVVKSGKIVESGDFQLAKRIEEKGFEN